MSAAATAFFGISVHDASRRQVAITLDPHGSGYEAVGGFDAVYRALQELTGSPLIEMSGSREIGDVLEIRRNDAAVRVLGQVADDRAWGKVEAGVYKGVRLNLYGSSVGAPFYVGRMLLVDAPEPQDVILRRAGAPRGCEVALAVDEAYAAARRLEGALNDRPTEPKTAGPRASWPQGSDGLQ